MSGLRVEIQCLYLDNADVSDIRTFTVYGTAFDLEKSIIFDTTVKITGHVHFPLVAYVTGAQQ